MSAAIAAAVTTTQTTKTASPTPTGCKPLIDNLVGILPAITALSATINSAQAALTALGVTSPDLSAISTALDAVLAGAMTIVTCTAAPKDCMGLITPAGDIIESFADFFQNSVPGVPELLNSAADTLTTGSATTIPALEGLLGSITTLLATVPLPENVKAALNLIKSPIQTIINCLS
ncbi:hypothetical protein EC968_000490 [Mortierella alpina]|nr:hypothetical protein EC968_000490 [Mortierella alpina]